MENSQLITDPLLRLLAPEAILELFEISDVSASEQSIELELRARKELTLEALKGKDVVLDVFCNPIELQSFPLKGKATYIKLFLRRWKPRGQAKHSTNSYDFAQPGTKATRAFGAFLKGSFGLTPTVFQRARHRVMHSRK